MQSQHYLGVFFRDYMDRLVDETEALGGTVNSSALTSNRPEPVPDQQLNILNSFTASDLTGKNMSIFLHFLVKCGTELYPLCRMM